MRNTNNKTPAEATPTAQAQGEGKPPRQSASVGKDIYQAVTDQILEAMGSGLFKGGAMWNRTEGAGGLPVNHSTGVAYSGVNVLLLWMAAQRGAYTQNRWLTFKQAAAKGAQVRAGSKAVQCVFFKTFEKETPTGEKEVERFGVAKAFYVFNIEQIDGLPAMEPEGPKAPEFSPDVKAEAILWKSGAKIKCGGTQAYYHRGHDQITMPDRVRFSSATNFYATALHELTHWTGHESRCAREFGQRFGDAAYAFEELVAELGSAFLVSELGMLGATIEGHAAYLDHWRKILKEDKQAIFTAAAAAAKAHRFVMALA